MTGLHFPPSFALFPGELSYLCFLQDAVAEVVQRDGEVEQGEEVAETGVGAACCTGGFLPQQALASHPGGISKQGCDGWQSCAVACRIGNEQEARGEKQEPACRLEA